MGNICSSGSSVEKKFNKSIEKANKEANKVEAAKIKILLLGAGESGKSTLFKQMRILYGETKFTEKERRNMVPIIHQNVLYNLSQLTTEVNSKTPFDENLKTLWNSSEVQEKFKLCQRNKVQVHDNISYFMANFDKICGSNYVPDDQDILHTRIRTSGIVEASFKLGENNVVMVDVGGQRNERRKWIHAFDNVDCILFVAAVSEYDEVLYEDNSVKRLEESVELFQKVLNEKVFNSNGYILFLNKIDLLKKKLAIIPFEDKDYQGTLLKDLPEFESQEALLASQEFNLMFQETVEFLKNKFISKVPSNKQVSVKLTCATDTENVSKIMDSCKDLFLQQQLVSNGFA